MQTIFVAVHLLLAIGLVGLVLIQHGKGADAGAAFGSGASSTVFGARGAGSFLTRVTGILAALFFATSMALAYFSMQSTDQPTLMDAEESAVATEPSLPPASEISTTPVAPPGVTGSEVPAIPGGESPE